MAGSHDDIRLTPFFGLGLENIGLSKVYEFSSNRRTIRKVMGGVGHLACMTFFSVHLLCKIFPVAYPLHDVFSSRDCQ